MKRRLSPSLITSGSKLRQAGLHREIGFGPEKGIIDFGRDRAIKFENLLSFTLWANARPESSL
jgi:hypothetical protein